MIKRRYEVRVTWCVETESEAQANEIIWDCIDGHNGITSFEVVRQLVPQDA